VQTEIPSPIGLSGQYRISAPAIPARRRPPRPVRLCGERLRHYDDFSSVRSGRGTCGVRHCCCRRLQEVLAAAVCSRPRRKERAL